MVRDQNKDVDLFIVMASGEEHAEIDTFFMTLHPTTSVYRSLISNNVVYLRVFEDDIQIKDFMQVHEEFVNLICDEQDEDKLRIEIGTHVEVLQLKTNVIPRGLVSLESMYDDVKKAFAHLVQQGSLNLETKSVDIGFDGEERLVKIKANLNEDMNKLYCNFL